MHYFKLLLLVTITLISITSYAKEAYCTWEKNIDHDRVINSTETIYKNYSNKTKAAIKQHLPFGMPSSNGSNETLLAQENYINWYDKDLRVSLWTSIRLTKKNLEQKEVLKIPREDSFRSDPRIESYERSECADYKEGIFDQGHMVPNASLQHSYQAMDNSFLMSNMTPQHCAFNRGIWQILESLQRKWATEFGEIFVISGTIFDRNSDGKRDSDQIAWRMKGKRGPRVAIPSHQYKVLLRKNGTKWHSLSFIMPNIDLKVSNSNALEYLKNHIQTTTNIDAVTGIDFSNGKEIIEGTDLWSFAGKMPSSLAGRCKNDYADY